VSDPVVTKLHRQSQGRDAILNRPVAMSKNPVVGLSLTSRVIGALQVPLGVDLGVGLCSYKRREGGII
jgi:hypothetical protein